MNLAVILKNKIGNIPPSLGNLIAKIPFSLRPGISKIYRQRLLEIERYDNFNLEKRNDYIYKQIKRIVIHAYKNIPFYKEFYSSKEFNPNMLKCYDDINRIPVLKKNDLLEYDIEKRSFKTKNRYIVNTGGTSGNPLSLYILPDSMGHEWAHMHTIWGKLGFKQSDLRLTFGGRSDVGDGIKYDAVRHQFNINIYSDFNMLRDRIFSTFNKYDIKYLHGYPSAIYEFAIFVENDIELKKLLGKRIQGVFLGSEFPHLYYRETIEKVFDTKTISWYGHTERAVLAYEKEEQFKYYPFQTYGYTETIMSGSGEYELVSTSFYNLASPLIRYNTEDVVENPIMENGILASFNITKGRSGEFVLDKIDKKIALTGLIFGRHHRLFDYSKQIQVSQKEKGKVTILYCSDKISEGEAPKLFDSNNVLIDFVFKQIDKPIKTSSGKIKLLIDSI